MKPRVAVVILDTLDSWGGYGMVGPVTERSITMSTSITPHIHWKTRDRIAEDLVFDDGITTEEVDALIEEVRAEWKANGTPLPTLSATARIIGDALCAAGYDGAAVGPMYERGWALHAPIAAWADDYNELVRDDMRAREDADMWRRQQEAWS